MTLSPKLNCNLKCVLLHNWNRLWYNSSLELTQLLFRRMSQPYRKDSNKMGGYKSVWKSVRQFLRTSLNWGNRQMLSFAITKLKLNGMYSYGLLVLLRSFEQKSLSHNVFAHFRTVLYELRSIRSPAIRRVIRRFHHSISYRFPPSRRLFGTGQTK